MPPNMGLNLKWLVSYRWRKR